MPLIKAEPVRNRTLRERGTYWAARCRGAMWVVTGTMWRATHPRQAAEAARALEALGPTREAQEKGAEPDDAVPRGAPEVRPSAEPEREMYTPDTSWRGQMARDRSTAERQPEAEAG
jgi:hypothetical protein